jgi:hypothetical protein
VRADSRMQRRLFLVILCHAFVAVTMGFTALPRQIGRKFGTVRPTQSLGISSFFDSLESFFDPNKKDNQTNNDDEEDEEAAGTSRIVTIPVKSLKPGGLRLFLMFYLMGEQNTPDRNSWRAVQPTTDEYILDFLFHDQSALLCIHLKEEEIIIDRAGSQPSNGYTMQESLIVEGILNELESFAFDESVKEDDRLLLLQEPQDAIEKARDALAFG